MYCKNVIYSKKLDWVNIALVLLYCGVIIYLSANHEVWRDEVRALSLVTESNSIVNLLENLHNEGHPCLWYLLLYFTYQIFKAPIVLKATHIFIATIAIVIFVTKAPFTKIQKLLFTLGYFPLYEYAVISRNYGIGMLLLFILFSLYKIRFKNPLLFGVILALLANTSAPALIISIAFTASLIVEVAFKRPISYSTKTLFGTLTAVFGIILSIIQITPDTTTVVTNIYQHSLKEVLVTIPTVAIATGTWFHQALGANSVLLANAVVWIAMLLLYKKKTLLVIFYSAAVGLAGLFQLVYPGMPRHQGFLYLLLIGMLWLDKTTDYKEATASPVGRWIKECLNTVEKHKNHFLYLVLTLQVIISIPAIYKEIRFQFSASKSFTTYVKKHSDLNDAIVIAEPDFIAESFPYYLNNKIYIPREERFGKTVSFTSANQNGMTLTDIINTAEEISHQNTKPILLVIGHNLNPLGPYTINFGYNKTFAYTNESLETLNKDAKMLASFKEAVMSNENFTVFLVENYNL